MFHHFPTEAGVGLNCLVRSTDFTYAYEELPNDPRNPIHSVLLSVSSSGYKRQGAGYLKKSLPPLEFEYSQAIIQEAIRDIDPKSLENLPYGVDGSSYQWVDLDGEGVPGILTEQADGWFYKRNLSPTHHVDNEGKEYLAPQFGPVELVASKPTATLAGGQAQDAQLMATLEVPVGARDELVWRGTAYRLDGSPSPQTIGGRVLWRSPLKYANVTG